MQIHKPSRLAAIEALPTEMQDYALVDWPTVALLLGKKDIEDTRDLVKDAGVPLTRVSERKQLPPWGKLREWLKSVTA